MSSKLTMFAHNVRRTCHWRRCLHQCRSCSRPLANQCIIGMAMQQGPGDL